MLQDEWILGQLGITILDDGTISCEADTEPILDYLNRDTKILDLIRERNGKILEDFNLTEFEEQLYSLKKVKSLYFSSIEKELARKFEKLFLNNPTEVVEKELNSIFKDFFSIVLSEEQHPCFCVRYKTSNFFNVSIMQKGVQVLNFIAPKLNYTKKEKDVIYTMRDKEKSIVGVCSLGHFLARCFVIKNVIDFISNEECEIITELISKTEQNMQFWLQRIYKSDNDEIWDQRQKFFSGKEEVIYKRVERERSSLDLAYYYSNVYTLDKCYPDLSKVTSSHFFKKKGVERNYSIPFVECENSYCTIFAEKAKILVEKADVKRQLEREKSQYASSYETKQNIPQYILLQMQESVLNNRFGYVEFDEECDMQKCSEIANEVIAFLDKYFPEVYLKEHVIRFRRLGKYRAAGLYFSGYNCLCVDVTSPSSFIHEFGHLFDQYSGYVSLNAKFVKVRDAYETAILDLMNKDAEVQKRMSGNTKYNKKYYVSSREVFARSFEIYVSRIMKVNNSLMTSDFDNVYCEENEAYFSALCNYFDEMFKTKGM